MSIIQGFHAIYARIATDSASVERVLVDKSRRDQRMSRFVETVTSAGIPLELVDRQTITQNATGRHQGVIAYVRAGAKAPRTLKSVCESLAPTSLILAIDGVSDPHNLGACLRVADGAGVDAVILPKERSVPITPTVSRVSAGADQALDIIQVNNLVEALKSLQRAGAWVVGASDDASDDLSLMPKIAQSPLVVVMGSEEKGMRHLTRQTCDYLLALPMRGVVSSLNVSVATGIILYHIRHAQAYSE